MSRVEQVAVLKHDKAVICVLLSHHTAITASVDKTVRVWETRTGELLHILTHSTPCVNLDISSDKTLLAVAHSDDGDGDDDGGVAVWSMDKFEKLADIKLGDTQDVRFFNDRTIVAGNNDGEIHMINMNNKGTAF